MINIAIDGPAGAGKSTVAKYIAKKLGIIYLDTGAMYRAVALKALRLGIDPSDTDKVLPVLLNTVIDIIYKEDGQHILLDKEDVSREIREHSVSKAASDISKIKEIRLKLVELQREIASQNSVVMDGRDIGSYVLPEADFKFYLTAAPEVRAKRRCAELAAKGQKCSYAEILKDINIRDENDSKREFAPLVKAEGALLIDSSYMPAEEVCEKILSVIRRN